MLLVAKSFASVAIVYSCAERTRLNAGDGPSLVPPLAVRLDAKQVPTVVEFSALGVRWGGAP
jgi:hypothetical protein